MDIWETNKLILFIAFVVPGFISLKTYETIFPSLPKDASKQIIDAVAYSCINYGILFMPTLALEESGFANTYPKAYLAYCGFAILIAPILWCVIYASIRHSERAQNYLPHPIAKPWDYVFKKRRSYWVIVTLKDGKQIPGKYSTNSFVSSAPEKEQIYLEECWHLNEDGGFERARDTTEGILIVAAEISHIELFNYPT